MKLSRMKIPVGTQSVLWGTHQFLWHPFTVLLAWKRVYGHWPNWWQLVAIIFHDSPGYWGCTDMDGPSGVQHPYAGAEIAGKIVDLFSKKRGWDVRVLCLFHSSAFAKLCNNVPSALYLPDKVSLLFDPRGFYLFRARLSGELTEYMVNNPKGGEDRWFEWYKKSVQNKLNAHDNTKPI